MARRINKPKQTCTSVVVSAIPACLSSNSERVTKLLIMMLVSPKRPWPPVNLVHSQSRQIPLPARLEEVLLYECVRVVYISHYVFIKHVHIYKMAQTFLTLKSQWTNGRSPNSWSFWGFQLTGGLDWRKVTEQGIVLEFDLSSYIMAWVLCLM